MSGLTLRVIIYKLLLHGVFICNIYALVIEKCWYKKWLIRLE